jgi:basic membrane protein A and related proteins
LGKEEQLFAWRHSVAGLLACLVALLAVGCGGGGGGGQGEGPGRVALVIAQGGLGDESYNDLANKGFQEGLKKNDLEGNTIESEDIVAQGEQVLRRASEGDFGLVIDLEFSHGEILGPIAQDSPDVNWAILNTVVKGDNVASVLFQEQQGSYLAGALAAMVTADPDIPGINPEKKIGVIGGTKSVGIDKFIVGYIQGAEDVDPDTEVLVRYANTFGDPSKGKQLAQSMYEEGADIVYQVAGGTGTGVIQAAKEADSYAIGVDTDQDDLAKGNVLTSMVKRTDLAVERLITDYAEGNYPGGKTLNLGLEGNYVGLTDYRYTKDVIPAEYRERVDKLRQQIIDGDIKVWNVVEQGYPDFFSS